MLLHITETALPSIRNPTESTVAALESLATGAREGKHILHANEPILDAIFQIPDLSGRALGMYRSVHNQMPQTGALLLTLRCRVDIVGDSCRPRKRTDSGVIVASLPLQLFADTMLAQKAVLLCENLRDAHALVTVAEVVLEVKTSSNILLQIEKRGGGGSSTADEYENIQNATLRLCLCVVDSDKKAPSDDLGPTARRLQSVDDDSRPATHVIILDARELENIIPLEQYEQALSRSRHATALTALRSLDTCSDYSIRQYVDLKRPTRLRDVLELDRDDPVFRLWTESTSELQSSLGLAPQCTSRNTCRNPEDCRCVLFPGFGDRVLDKILELFADRSRSALASCLCSRTKEQWMSLGSIIIAWGVGGTLRAA